MRASSFSPLLAEGVLLEREGPGGTRHPPRLIANVACSGASGVHALKTGTEYRSNCSRAVLPNRNTAGRAERKSRGSRRLGRGAPAVPQGLGLNSAL